MVVVVLGALFVHVYNSGNNLASRGHVQLSTRHARNSHKTSLFLRTTHTPYRIRRPRTHHHTKYIRLNNNMARRLEDEETTAGKGSVCGFILVVGITLESRI